VPAGNQAANGENKHQTVYRGKPDLLDSCHEYEGEKMRTTMKKLILAFLLLSAALPAAGSAFAAPLYFPHITTIDGWQTEIAIVNTSDQSVTGTLKAYSDGGVPGDTKPVTLSAHGRRQITVADEFTNNTAIGYIIFDTNSDTVQGYTKFYQAGKYRVAIPAVKEVNASNVIYITHIASDTEWWTGISLVNTTSTAKTVTININDGQTRQVTLAANGHKALDLFDYQPQPPDVQSAVITNASGIVGLEVFATYNGKEMEGILLTDKTASSLYYPYVVNDADWWTGIVAYNPFQSPCNITITSYNADGTYLSSLTDSISGMQKYVGTVGTQIVLPAQTSWFRIDSTRALSGFEVIGTRALDRLASYAGNGGIGVKTGVFAKIEKFGGETFIVLVNTENSTATVTLTAYTDDGTALASKVITLESHAMIADDHDYIFGQNIPNATYITYTSDRNMVGLQLNYSADGTMFDGLPGLSENGNVSGSACTYEYSQWEACQNGVHTRTVTSAAPQGCTGAPVLTESCTPPSTPADMVLLPAGSFQMGGVAGEGDVNELPAHAVTLSAFYLEKYEVTQALWADVYFWATVNGYTFDNVGTGTARSDVNHPVLMVSWYDVVKWLNARSEKEGRTPVYYTDATQTTAAIYRTGQVDVTNSMTKWQANGYRLPTEAEWEYAARGGTTTRFYTGYCISSDDANYDGRPSSGDGCPSGVYLGGTLPVGSFKANPWGLYDMAGNVNEWTWDWYDSYSSSAVTNPRGPDSGTLRVFRDGGWYERWMTLRSASRRWDAPNNGDRFRGFRCTLSQP
jgi:formylglycine-generating enzyme required for sulfatase activity